MNMRLKSFLFFILFILIIFLSAHIRAQEEPSLYGKVKLRTSDGDIPFKNAKVELLDVRNEEDKVLFNTYTDSYGNFAFYEIPENDYYLKVLKGERVFDQLEGDERINRRLVNVIAQSTRLPDIIVLP